MTVEWLRSCYQSNWHLFKDSPATSTPGRYYKSPTGTPHFGALHLLGSKTWDDSNWQSVAVLGENRSSTAQYDPGDLPAVNVVPNFVGTVDCISSGEVIGNAVPYSAIVNGFVPACIVPAPTDLAVWEAMSDYDSCSVQLAGARIIDWSYGANPSSIFDLLRGLLTASYALNWHPPTTLLPAVTTAVSTSGTLVWVDGTVNFQQFALQAAYSLIGPTNVGICGTSPFWATAGAYIVSVLGSDGYQAGQPIFLCGHSYGAVAALLAGSALIAGQPNLQVRFLTYGCPHVGDSRFLDLIRRARGVNLRNYDDIVTALAPDLDLLNAIIIALSAPELGVWPSWKKAPYGSMMGSNGSLAPDEEPLLDYPTLLAFAGDVLSALPYPTVTAHRVTTYYSRIFARCSEPEWPLKGSDYTLLTATGYILLETGDDVLLEVGDPVYLEAQ